MLFRSITDLQETKKKLDKIVEDRYRNYKIDKVLIVLGFYAALLILTCHFTWNIMEPCTYFLGSVVPIVSYIYVALKNEEFNPHTYLKKILEDETKFVYKEYGFNFERLNQLVEQKRELSS